MRHPRRVRNVALGFFIFGLIATPGTFLIPDGSIPTPWHTALFIAGIMSLLFGGVLALQQHFEARAHERLLCGEGVIARWRIDPLAWQAFLGLNRQAGAEKGALLNQLTLVKEAPPEGIEIIVARDGVMVGGDFMHVPFRGTPRVESVFRLRNDQSACIELNLYYPNSRYGPTRLALRYPIPVRAEDLAARLVAHYQASELVTRRKPGIAFRKPKLIRNITLIIVILCAASFAGGLLLKDNHELGDLPLFMAVIGAVAGIGAALLLLIVQIKLMVDRKADG
jgi:hypothetical protein